MPTYVLQSPGIACTARELDAALMRLREFEESPGPHRARWIHSYALREADDRFGLASVFEADDAPALRRHAGLARLHAGDVLPVVASWTSHAFAPVMVHMVRRRRFCGGLADLENAAAARRRADDAMKREVHWLRSYAVREDDGTFGMLCLYQGIDADALHRHAARAGMPAHDVVPVIGLVTFRREDLSLSVPAVA